MSLWREDAGLFSKKFSIFSRVPTFFQSTYSKEITAKKQKLHTHAMYTLDQQMIQLFGLLTCSSPCAGRHKVSLGTWLFSCSLWKSHQHGKFFVCSSFIGLLRMSPVQILSNTTVHFCIRMQACLEGDNRAVCLPEILGTDMDVGFGFFPYRY